jgi:hypothetical protein
MHTTRIETDSAVYTVHHNGDFSGDVIVRGDSEAMDSTLYHIDHSRDVHIPFEVMERLVAEKVRQRYIEWEEQNYDRRELIGQFEEMSVEELLYG